MNQPKPPVWVALARTDFSLRHVQVGPWSTRVLEAGEGPALILMHGTGGHLEAYAHNVAELSTTHRVIAFDFPGHGGTTHADTDVTIDVLVDHLVGLLDTLGVDRAVLNGESLGGWVAVKFAARYPDRVRALVLNTPGGTMSTPEVMERIRTLSQAAADDPNPERIRQRLEWLMADNRTVTDELVAIRTEHYSRPGFAASMRHILCLQDLDIRRQNMITDAELERIDVPTLVVWTSDDPSGPAGAGIDMANRVRDGRFELIEDAGHWPQWEQSERFNVLVRDFLAVCDR